MKRYEYKFLGSSEREGMVAAIKARTKKRAGSAEIFNFLGEQGWQYVETMKGDNYLFIRELDPKADFTVKLGPA